MTKARKAELRREALRYAGRLVYEVANSYADPRFDDLCEEERVFVDEQIRAIGEGLLKKGNQP